jgi:Uma2 family endonuclease
MATAEMLPARVTRPAEWEFGPYSAGTGMSPREFDRASFVEGWCYELINGVLVVSPIPLESESDPNEELGYLLRTYQATHPQGAALNKTLSERIVKTKRNRRRADRVIWAGLGRRPRRGETPTVVAEFVSEGKRDRNRDSEEKREEHRKIGVQEYWIIDRFYRTMTVYVRRGKRWQKRVVTEAETYTTDLLPGFELPLARLFALADEWVEDEPEKE